MKTSILLVAAACCALFPLPAAAQEEGLSKAEAAKEERMEKRLAADWMKEELNRLRKTTAVLKKVKNAKTAASAAKELQGMYGLGGSGQQTAMGAAGPATKPQGAAYAEQEKKNASTLKKVKTEARAEVARIQALNLNDADLDAALEWLEENRLAD